MKKLFIRHLLLLEILIIAIISFLPLMWFSPGQMVLGYDSGYPVNYLNYFSQRSFLWLGSQNFGYDITTELGLAVFHAFHALVMTLGASQFVVQHITFPFWFFAISISFYAFMRYLFSQPKQWSIRFTGLAAYLFNMHLFSYWLQGEEPALTAYILLPLSALFLFKFFRKELSPIITACIFSILLLFLNGGGIQGIPLLGPTILFVVSLTFYSFLLSAEKKEFLSRLFRLILFFIPLYLLTNAYYLFPFLKGFLYEFSARLNVEGGVVSSVGWVQFISAYTSFDNLFRLQGVLDIYTNPLYYLRTYITDPVLIVGSFIVPILSYASFLVVPDEKEKRIVMFFIGYSLLALFFTAGGHMPSGLLYIFLLEHLPGFAAFRSAYYKFDPGIYFSFAVLLGITIYYISERIKKYAFIVPIVFIIFIAVYNYPYFQKQNFIFNSPFTTMPKIPQYVFDFATYENKTADDGSRTLILPPPNYGTTFWAYKWGYWGTYPIFPLLTNKNFISYDANFTPSEEGILLQHVYELLREGDKKGFLMAANNLQIHDVIITDDTASGYWYSPTENPALYHERINSIQGVKKIWSEGAWTIYQLPDTGSHNLIQSVGSLTAFSGELTQQELNLTQSHFVETSQITPQMNKDLPVTNTISPLVCLSCTLLSDPGSAFKPTIINTVISPNSFLYPLKVWRDAQSLKNTSGDIQVNTYLGLSLRRFYELNSLTEMPDTSQLDGWITSAKLLDNYWGNIENALNTKYLPQKKYGEIADIFYVAENEGNNLTNLYQKLREKNSNIVTDYLGDAVVKIDTIIHTLSPLILETDWTKNFVYQAPSGQTLLIDKGSLPIDSRNNTIPPVGNKLLFATTSATVTLHFPDISAIAPLKQETVTLTQGVQSCLVGSVINLDWTGQYKITTSVNGTKRAVIFVVENHPTLRTADTPLFTNKYLIPSETFYPLDTGVGSNTFSFSPEQDDTSVNVYFCTDILNNPQNIFSQIRIQKVVIPLVYTNTKMNVSELVQPKISYVKINPTHYRIAVTNANEPYILAFFESFSPYWKLSISPADHFVIDGYGNAWYITKTGTYTIDMTFSLQSDLMIGIIITSIAAISIGVFVIMKFLRK